MAGDRHRGARSSDRSRSCSWSVSVAEVDGRREAFALDEVILHRARYGLARSCASIGERRSVGSWIAAAKPRDQWRARTGHRASGFRPCTRRWKPLWAVRASKRVPRFCALSHATERKRREARERNRSPLTRGRRGQSSVPQELPVRPGKRRRDKRVAEVSAAQPCTRSKTPRYGSTARSGSRLLESMEIVSSRPEARWASSNAHRPGPFLYARPFLHRDREEAVRESAKGGNGAGRA
jgi:hypothetical protein